VETVAARLPFAVLILLGLAAAVAAETSRLAGYSFDEQDLATGPDTVAIFQAARGQVRLSSNFRMSGYRSVEIRDVARDGDFPELQGYFPVQRRGRLYAHFSFLTTNPREPFNIAIAGPRRFGLSKDGIAFWLLVDEEGVLRHMSDSIPKRLTTVRSFVWYTVDVDYDIERGRYDLKIWTEDGTEPVVALPGQTNAGNHPGSAVDVFSFIGDLEDASNVTYYVDDVVIGTSEDVRLGPFVAPGRRKLFINSYLEYRKLQARRPRCFPVEGETNAEAAQAFRAGCAALEDDRAKEAEVLLEQAAAAAPQVPLYRLASAMAAFADGRLDVMAARLRAVYPQLFADARFAVALGMLATARGDLARGEELVRAAGEKGLDRDAMEAYYYALMSNERYAEARAYARRFSGPAQGREAAAAQWLERSADAAFFAGDRDEALADYSRAVELVAGNAPVLLKLSDLAFLSGDWVTERALRERYFGALRGE
jgi:hypothetical protein